MPSLVRLAVQQVVRVSWWVVVGMVSLVIPIHTSPGIEPPVGTQIVHPRDKTIMVYVPSGQFVMGLAAAEAEVLGRPSGVCRGGGPVGLGSVPAAVCLRRRIFY